jgi:hypothetical protein
VGASLRDCHCITLAVWIFSVEPVVCVFAGARRGLAPVWMLWNTLHCWGRITRTNGRALTVSVFLLVRLLCVSKSASLTRSCHLSRRQTFVAVLGCLTT